MPEDLPDSSNKKIEKFIKKFFSTAQLNLSDEQKIMTLIDDVNKRGIIELSTRNMIDNIFDFDDLTANELMTHRTDISAVEIGQSIVSAAKIFMKTGYSRIPVFSEDIDNIVGLLYAKDLLKYVGVKIDKDVITKDMLRQVVYIPRTKNCSELLAHMISCKIQMAVVVDEYGGTEGLITLEDLIESIVGNIQDEYDNEEEEIKKISENVFTVDGGASIDDVSDLVGVNIDNSECDTVAGLMLEHLGDIPKDYDRPTILLNELKFTAIKIEDRRISKVLVEKI